MRLITKYKLWGNNLAVSYSGQLSSTLFSDLYLRLESWTDLTNALTLVFEHAREEPGDAIN